VIVDAHQHFWNPALDVYPWLTDDIAVVKRRFGPEDLEPVLDDYGVGGTVLVQALGSLEETRRLLAVAEATPFVLGVVGWIDLTDPGVADVLAEIGSSALVGIRHQVEDEPDPEWLVRADVQRGIAAVGEAGLTYDLLVRPVGLPAAIETVRRHPEMRFVVDHLAKPPIRSGDTTRWARDLETLSAFPNVSCKLSGLVNEADRNAWRGDELVPFHRRALDWFGPDRAMFGSDWPLCLVAADYGAVLGLVHEAIGGLAAGEREAVLGGTATRVYGL
jgi:L-fuconolactonase